MYRLYSSLKFANNLENIVEIYTSNPPQIILELMQTHAI